MPGCGAEKKLMRERRRGICRSVCNALALSLLFAACEPGGPRAPDVPPLPRVVRTAQGLELHGESALLGTDPETLRVAVQVWNPGRQSVQIENGACALRVLAYPAAAPRLDDPVWDSHRWRGSGGCRYAWDDWLALPVIGPVGALPIHRFAVYATVPEFLGDSLRLDRYRLVTRLQLSKDTVELSAGQVRLRP